MFPKKIVLGHLPMAKMVHTIDQTGMSNKNMLCKRYFNHRTNINLQEYKLYRNRLSSVIRTEKIFF